MPGADSIRVAIIDDDRALVDGLRRIIDGAEGFTCAGAFGSVEEALPALADTRPDVLLLDIQLPGMEGDQAIELICRTCPAVEILMLTVFSDRARVFTSICNGAHGYLLKSTPPAKLLDAIRSAQAGGSPLSPEIARQIVGLFQRADSAQPAAELTAQEQRLLTLLAEGYSYQSAADRMHVSVNTVRNYVRKIYEKLHVHSKSEAVSKALRRGVI
ncbi:MAG TPA: response regulator transcription factor [Bryobacteraceae bacterium]|nr:response regulator transcription factor [Bryobacteraceae bacterium]HXJ39318.1 response regulator transcription factor [Bryobacteraceae bacterium]